MSKTYRAQELQPPGMRLIAKTVHLSIIDTQKSYSILNAKDVFQDVSMVGAK